MPFSKGGTDGELSADNGAMPHVSPAGAVGASADQGRQRSPLATRPLGEPTDIFARNIRESVIVGYTL